MRVSMAEIEKVALEALPDGYGARVYSDREHDEVRVEFWHRYRPLQTVLFDAEVFLSAIDWKFIVRKTVADEYMRVHGERPKKASGKTSTVARMTEFWRDARRRKDEVDAAVTIIVNGMPVKITVDPSLKPNTVRWISDPLEEYVRNWGKLPDPPIDLRPRIDGLTHDQIRTCFLSNMYDADSKNHAMHRKLTSAQKQWAREDWSAQLRAKTEAAKKQERARIVVDHGDDE